MLTLALSILFGLLIGVGLGALGGGGSILTVPVLVYALGENARTATTGSLVIVGITALMGAFGHARSHNVRWVTGAVLGITGVAASYLGTALNRRVDPDVLLLAFAVLMLVAAAGMLHRAAQPVTARAPSTRGPAEASAPRSGPHPVVSVAGAARLLAAGLVVGFLTGFLGVGGGFVIVPVLVLVLGFPMPAAVGTSLLVIALNSAVALAARAGHATFDWAVIIPFTAAAVAGSVLGRHLANRVSGATLNRAFAGLLIAVAAIVGIHSGLSLT